MSDFNILLKKNDLAFVLSEVDNEEEAKKIFGEALYCSFTNTTSDNVLVRVLLNSISNSQNKYKEKLEKMKNRKKELRGSFVEVEDKNTF